MGDVGAGQATKMPAFDHARLADALSTELGADVGPDHLPFTAITVQNGQIEFNADGKTWSWDGESQSLRLLGSARGANDSLPGLATIERSRNGGEETYLTFVNKTDEAVSLLWVDARGRRHGYGQVKASSEYEQHTFAGHVLTPDLSRRLQKGNRHKIEIFKKTRDDLFSLALKSVFRLSRHHV